MSVYVSYLPFTKPGPIWPQFNLRMRKYIFFRDPLCRKLSSSATTGQKTKAKSSIQHYAFNIGHTKPTIEERSSLWTCSVLHLKYMDHCAIHSVLDDYRALCLFPRQTSPTDKRLIVWTLNWGKVFHKWINTDCHVHLIGVHNCHLLFFL